jgi:hypothetical protein
VRLAQVGDEIGLLRPLEKALSVEY